MGMIMYLLRISKQELESYIDKPELFLENRVDDAYSMDIDKAWGGILYLLTGKAFASGRC